ncbi:MAG: LacI family DNA-binding transcriptional regulator [Spirochaetales bacterium]|nr:LacI family DNA-binding transcriptional regulator [Spirochaetales bacterium]
MGRHIGLKDIAQLTGFSVKTVSRALNDHPDVNEQTRKQILEAAEKNSYYPNQLAKSLRTRQAFTIGYVVPDITNEFYGKVGIAIEGELKKHHYGLLVSFTQELEENEIDSLKLLLSKRVDGIILATVGTTGELIRQLIEDYHLPIVTIDNRASGVRTNAVLHDNRRGAYLLTRHLIEHGRRVIGCVTGPLSETSGCERLEGYEQALSEAGIRVDKALIRSADWRVGGGYQATLELMSSAESRPTGLFVGNSIMALGVYKALKELALEIPEDVAVVAFDSMRFTDTIEPPLTTLESVEDKIGETAARILLDKITGKGPENAEEHLIASRLCIRRSCGCRGDG